MNKFIDCFTFCGEGSELDILEIRLNELKDLVNYHVLVESTKTQTFLDKPLFFEQNRFRFKDFLHKIIHVTVEDFPDIDKNSWQMENFQRNSIIKGLKYLIGNSMIDENDIILISDLDEIPKAEKFKDLNIEQQISFKMTYNPFFVNLQTENKSWIGTTAIKLDVAIKNNYTPQYLRNNKDHVDIIEDGGIHFGNQGGKEFCYKKLFNTIEPFNKSVIVPYEEFSKEFDRKIKPEGSFLFSDKQDDSIKLKLFPEEKLPKYLIKNKEKFNHLFYK